MSPDDEEKYIATCEMVNEYLTDQYHILGNLADELYALVRPRAEEPTTAFLDRLEKRLALDEVRGSLLSAKHAMHGGLTALVKARATFQRIPRRPADGEPDDYIPPCADDQAEERARDQE